MKTASSNQDHDLFVQEMAGVTPLKRADTTTLNKTENATPGQYYRRLAAQYSEEEKNCALSLILKQTLTESDWLSYKRDGIQHGVFKNLRTGKYPLEATLNLNGMKPEQTRNALIEFVQECQSCNLRSVLITFGRSKSTGTLIKSYLAQWLPALEEVQAFYTAQIHHGGDRAVYVLLRKSVAKKAENRERHAARLAD